MHKDAFEVGPLLEVFPDIYKEGPVLHANRRSDFSDKQALVGQYLGTLAERHTFLKDEANQTSERSERLTSKLLIDEADMPESVLNHVARQHPEADPEDIYDIAVNNAHRNQRASWHKWVDYLKTGGSYPTWFKYYVLRSVQRMGVYDADNSKFYKRSASTVAPFPPLNPEAVGIVYKKFKANEEARAKLLEALPQIRGEEGLQHVADRMYRGNKAVAYNDVKRIVRQEKRDFSYLKWEKPELEEAGNQDEVIPTYSLDKLGFSKLYADALDEAKGRRMLPELRKIVDGTWHNFISVKDTPTIEQKLSGWGTRWCIASGLAGDYLERNGRLEIYFTKDLNGDAVVPRLAIASRDNHILELRGIMAGQAVEPEIASQAFDAVAKYDNGEVFAQGLDDLVSLTIIGDKNALGHPLSVEELKLIYQVDRSLTDFGYQFADDDDMAGMAVDDRLSEIISTRDKESDIELMLSGAEEIEKLKIALTIDKNTFWKMLAGRQDPELTRQAFQVVIDKKALISLTEKQIEQLPSHCLPNDMASRLFEQSDYVAQEYDVRYKIQAPNKFFDLFEKPVFDVDVAEVLTRYGNNPAVLNNIGRFRGLGDDYAQAVIFDDRQGIEAFQENVASFNSLGEDIAKDLINQIEMQVDSEEIEYILEKLLPAFDSAGRQILLDKIEDEAVGTDAEDIPSYDYVDDEDEGDLLPDDVEDEGYWGDFPGYEAANSDTRY